jgi:hypothetical protein
MSVPCGATPSASLRSRNGTIAEPAISRVEVWRSLAMLGFVKPLQVGFQGNIQRCGAHRRGIFAFGAKAKVETFLGEDGDRERMIARLVRAEVLRTSPLAA